MHTLFYSRRHHDTRRYDTDWKVKLLCYPRSYSSSHSHLHLYWSAFHYGCLDKRQSLKWDWLYDSTCSIRTYTLNVIGRALYRGSVCVHTINKTCVAVFLNFRYMYTYLSDWLSNIDCQRGAKVTCGRHYFQVLSLHSHGVPCWQYPADSLMTVQWENLEIMSATCNFWTCTPTIKTIVREKLWQRIIIMQMMTIKGNFIATVLLIHRHTTIYIAVCIVWL